MDKLKVFFATFFLTIATGIIAQTTSIYDMKDTWNAGGTTFSAIKMTVTDTASAAGSKLLDLGASTGGLFTVGKNGTLTMTGTQYIKEQADAAADVSGYGQVWVNTATPNELWFTDDAGTDVQLGTPHTPEGTAVLSTGELVTKFLRADGDNTSSWQVPPFIANVVEDTTPQLGGTLDLNGFDITAVAPSTDVATAARTISGQSANLGAVVNTSASPLSLKMGDHATAGGTAGLVRVLAPNDTVVQSWNETGDFGGVLLRTDLTNNNYALGNTALNSVVVGSGINNIAIGSSAGTKVTTGDNNISIGKQAGANVNSSEGVIAIGTDALLNVSSSSTGNIGIGFQAGDSINDGDVGNIIIGYNAGASTTTPDYAVIIGHQASTTATSFSNSVHIGGFAAAYLNNNNVAIGYDAAGNATGADNVLIGFEIADNATSINHSVVIGSGVNAPATTLSDSLVIGNTYGNAIVGSFNARADSDWSAKDLKFQGPSALAAAVTNLDGGTATIQGGNGASGSAGDADGGNLILKGGTGYGTGSNGIVDLQSIVQVDPYSRHLQIPANAVSLGPTAPVNVTVNTAARCLEFDEGEEAFIQHEVPNDWVGGEDLVLEIDWIPNAAGIANGETVIWSFDLLSRAEGEDLDTGAVTTGGTTYTSSGATAQGTVVHTKLVLDYNDATNPLDKQDHFFVRFYHDATSTFNGKACVTALEYLYNSESFPQI